MESVITKQDSFFKQYKDQFGYTNPIAAPKLQKIVVSVGTGRKAKNDKHFNEMVADRLAKITGQKPSIRKSKVSIASFKLREGDSVGMQVTLRGQRMYSFFDKLIHIALPRTRDFRGIKRTSIDPMGNLTMGLKENSIFPVTSQEELRNIFGMSITLVSTASSAAEAEAFLEHLGVPFQKKDK